MMAGMAGFPDPQPGVRYLTEGGQETELMYKHGHELPEFAMYPLLDDPRAVADLRDMYTRYLEVAAAHGFVALMGGLDYRASPDWAAKLGISPAGLADYQLRSIEFLREVARPFDGLPTLVAGIVGPRGDAYGRNHTIIADEAEEYHGVQIATLREAGVDLVSAMTFNNVPEAVGVARAAASAGLPLSMSFMVDATGCIRTGPTLAEAITAVDDQAGDARPDFFGINCSHPVEFEPALEPGPWLERLRSLRPNASMAEKQALCQIGHLEAGDPELLGIQMAALARRLPQVDVWGGCCGTWDDHLAAIAGQLAGSVA
jgi:S-methylmethionine-dependent homocysteine/selenocysteine methylase